MRRYLYILAALLMCAACSKSEESATPVIDGGEGCVAIAFSSRNIVTSVETRSEDSPVGYTIPAALLPAKEDFSLTLYRVVDDVAEEVGSYDTIEEYNTAGISKTDGVTPTPPYLAAGDYRVVVSDGRDIETESATNACFSGTLDFKVHARDVDNEVEVVATLQNSIVRLGVTDWFLKYYAGGAELTITTEDGATMDCEFSATSPTDDQILFVEPETTLYLSGSAVKQPATESSTGATVTFSKNSIGKSTEGQMTTISADASVAGGTSITILFDDTITKINETSININQE